MGENNFPRHQGESSSTESHDSECEGIFIPLPERDSAWTSLDFVNLKFTEDDHEELESIIKVIDLQTEQRPPLLLLFPDLNTRDKERIAASTSTTQVTKILKGKRADFSLLKPSKKLNPEQSRLPPLFETLAEYYNEDDKTTS